MLVFIALVVIAISIFLSLFLKKRRYYEKYLSQFPGPSNTFFLGCGSTIVQEGYLKVLHRFQKEYGDICYGRVGPHMHIIFCSDLDFAKKVFSENLDKGSMVHQLESWLGSGLLTTPGHKWKTQRKMLNPAFNQQMLIDFIPIYDEQSKILKAKLQKISPVDSINIYNLISLCALDIICETSMGTPLNAQKNENLEYVQSVKEILTIMSQKVFAPWTTFKPMYFFTKNYRTEKKALSIISEYTDKIITSRIEHRNELLKDQNKIVNKEDEFNNGKSKTALLDILLDYSDKLTKKEIEKEVNSFLFAGHDTATTVMTFFLFEIAKHPRIQDKLFEEQKYIFGTDTDRPTTIRDIQEMKNLEMAIKETMRMYTPAVAFMREVQEDFEYDGKFIPKGVVVLLFLLGIHNNAKYFPQPEVFNPSRFEEQNTQAHQAFAAFGLNPRNCIGQKFAMHEMKVILGKLIRHFQFDCSIPEHTLELKAEALLVSKTGVNIKVTPRI